MEFDISETETLQGGPRVPNSGHTQWCKFMSTNLNFAREISRGGRGRTREGYVRKKGTFGH